MCSLDLLFNCLASNIIIILLSNIYMCFLQWLTKGTYGCGDFIIFTKFLFSLATLSWIVELAQYHPTPPLSPELPGSCQKEFKENKEPSPKAKRKQSVKISSVTLESMHWQNDSVQIIESASDLKNMDEFLLKKVHSECWIRPLSSFDYGILVYIRIWPLEIKETYALLT